MTGPLPLAEAARELDVSEATLRRWLTQGAPVASRGRRGRGRAHLIDPTAVRAWRAASDHDARLIEFAGALPELIGRAMADAFRLHPDKRQRAALAWLACAGWQLATESLADQLGHPGPDAIPPEIERLRKIAHGSRDF